ncbi:MULTISPECIES: ketopantoate reductase family protein [unclassified Chelatococcus]|uniref:ketopantoate reductase family protein n=1 Tax=unclassified Chelatococcus TaxID=2638111 RepID=UPI001BD0CCBB|nr:MULTISPECIES: ketopantoate reductase family protein [unclassified Chelatococcus]MBS7699755.1 ketopantoate reductase family protein [Chelatococcus sp. YT9]MBX3558101.1 ketopantoate reductase family protein [Chelatococcus sp.]
MASPFVIIGAGAIGSIVGAHLMRSGHDVVFIEANEAHADAIRRNGLRISGHLDALVRPAIHAPSTYDGPMERVLLAVKSRDTIAGLSPYADRLAADGYVLSLQNGLEEEKIAAIVGKERTIGAYLTFGGYYKEPGHIVYGGAGSFKIGELDGRETSRITTLRQALSAQQPVDVTENIFGYLWSKMALGSVYFGTAIIDAPVLEIYDDRRARAVLSILAGEAVGVADAIGIRTENCDGFDPKVFRLDRPTDDAAQTASWDAQRAYWKSHDNTHTGVWRDLKIHRRKTEVEWQVGAVIRAAEKAGVAVPHLKRLKATVESIENGDRVQSWEALYDIVG